MKVALANFKFSRFIFNCPRAHSGTCCSSTNTKLRSALLCAVLHDSAPSCAEHCYATQSCAVGVDIGVKNYPFAELNTCLMKHQGNRKKGKAAVTNPGLTRTNFWKKKYKKEPENKIKRKIQAQGSQSMISTRIKPKPKKGRISYI